MGNEYENYLRPNIFLAQLMSLAHAEPHVITRRLESIRPSVCKLWWHKFFVGRVGGRHLQIFRKCDLLEHTKNLGHCDLPNKSYEQKFTRPHVNQWGRL